MSTQEQTIQGVARAKFFAGHGVESRRVLVDHDGTVRVWDDVAGHYTLCHSLTRRASARIAREVAVLWRGEQGAAMTAMAE